MGVEGEKKREEGGGGNSFTLRTKRSGNHPGERNARHMGEAEGRGWPDGAMLRKQHTTRNAQI